MNKKKKNVNFADKPDRYRPIKCVLCKKCWLDVLQGRCIYGGPFAGFQDSDGNPLPLEQVIKDG